MRQLWLPLAAAVIFACGVFGDMDAKVTISNGKDEKQLTEAAPMADNSLVESLESSPHRPVVTALETGASLGADRRRGRATSASKRQSSWSLKGKKKSKKSKKSNKTKKSAASAKGSGRKRSRGGKGGSGDGDDDGDDDGDSSSSSSSTPGSSSSRRGKGGADNGANLIPLYRYWNPRLRDHFYTVDFSIFKDGKTRDGKPAPHGWQYQGVQAYVYRSPQTDALGQPSVPLYMYWNVRIGDHFYTTKWNELGRGKSGYEFKGAIAYLPSGQVPGSMPLYRYFNEEAGDHFYTNNWSHLGAGKNGWRYEGITGYTFPEATSDARPSMDHKDGNLIDGEGVLVPLYRYWNVHFRDHFYTTLWKEVDVGTHGWQYQGVQALVYAKKVAGTVPLHRYWNIQTLDHFYTTNFEVLGKGGVNGWTYEGVQCYVAEHRGADMVPLLRYYNHEIQDHLYTTTKLDTTSESSHGYKYEGIQAYVHPRVLPRIGRDVAKEEIDKVTEYSAKAVPLYRYFSESLMDHFYTTNWDTLKTGTRGWKYEGIQAYVFASQKPGTVPLERYWNARTGDHFFTTADPGSDEVKALSASGEWRHQGVAAYVYPPKKVVDASQAATASDAASAGADTTSATEAAAAEAAAADGVADGTVPLYRYFNAETNDHFYTTNWQELKRGSNGFAYQGITCYVVPNTQRQPVAPRGAKARPVPLFRYYSATSADHMYTTVPVKAVNGWEYQGTQAMCMPGPAEGLVPLYAYYDSLANDHYISVQWTGRKSDGWAYTGIVCYVPTEKHDGNVPLYRYYNARLKDHYYTTSWGELANGRAGYAYQGIAAYVYPPLKPISTAASVTAIGGSGHGDVGGDGDKGPAIAPLYRFYDASAKDHFYSTTQAVSGQMRAQGTVGHLLLGPAPGAVPLYRYFNTRARDHFYTVNWASLRSGGRDGWRFEGVQGYVYSDHGSGRVPLYRYYSKHNRDHMYAAEYLGRVWKSYRLQGITGYLLESGGPGTELPGTGREKLQPLYRYFSSANSDHYYTTRREVTDGARSHAYQGLAGYILKGDARGAAPLYAYFNTRVNDHYLTTDFGKLGRGGKYGWVFGGIEGYVYRKARAGTVPMYQYYNDETKDHYYTANWGALGKAGTDGWKYQGILGYIYSPEDSKAGAELGDSKV